MANIATKTARKAVKKTARKATKSATNYAKGVIVRGFAYWAIAALIGLLPTIGITLPEAFTGYDTIAMVAFIIAGFICFGRKLSVGRLIALARTFLK